MPEEPTLRTAMEAIHADLEIIKDPKAGEQIVLAAVNGVEQKMIMSQFIVEPTKGVQEAEKVYQETDELLATVGEALDGFIASGGRDSGEAGARAVEVRNLVGITREVAHNIACETREQDPREEGNGDNGNDNGHGDRDPGEAIRGPFVFFPRPGPGKENAFPLEIPCGGCGAVVKEFRGLQLRRRRRVITRTIEPWTARAKIIKEVVWVLEWVPAQLIKTITVKCDCDGKSTTYVDKKVVLDEELMTFWRNY